MGDPSTLTAPAPPTTTVPIGGPITVPAPLPTVQDALPGVNARGQIGTTTAPAPELPHSLPSTRTAILRGAARVLGRAARVLDLVIPTNGATLDDRVPQDEYERELTRQAEQHIRDGEDSWDVQREWHRAIDQHRAENVRVRGDRCLVGRHGDLKKICSTLPGEGSQSHHIVPDEFVRTGPRSNPTSRIISEDDGAAICIPGNAFVSGTLHNSIHADLNRLLATRGDADGTLPLSDVIGASLRVTIAYKPECTAQIIRQVQQAFQGVDTSQRVRIR